MTTPADILERAASPRERREQAEKQALRVQWVRSRVERLRDLRVRMNQMLADNKDIIWGSSWVGPRLFEASMHLDREVPQAEEWLNREEHRLSEARRAAGLAES